MHDHVWSSLRLPLIATCDGDVRWQGLGTPNPVAAATQWLSSARKAVRRPHCSNGFGMRFGNIQPPQVMVNTIQVLFATGSLEKMALQTHGFCWPFLSPRSSPGLEIGIYQLVSLRASIWLYKYILPMIGFVYKKLHFSRQMWKLPV